MSDNFHHIFETTFCSVHHIFGTTLQKCMPILEYSPLLLFYPFYSFTFLPFYPFITLKISKNPTPLACFR